MLHGRANSSLRLIRLGHHLSLVPCRHGRHLGAHLPNASSGAVRTGAGASHGLTEYAIMATNMRS